MAEFNSQRNEWQTVFAYTLGYNDSDTFTTIKKWKPKPAVLHGVSFDAQITCISYLELMCQFNTEILSRSSLFLSTMHLGKSQYWRILLIAWKGVLYSNYTRFRQIKGCVSISKEAVLRGDVIVWCKSRFWMGTSGFEWYVSDKWVLNQYDNNYDVVSGIIFIDAFPSLTRWLIYVDETNAIATCRISAIKDKQAGVWIECEVIHIDQIVIQR